MSILVTILGTLLATNLPMLVYAWLYMHVPNLVAAVLYFGLSIFLCMVTGQIVGDMRKRELEMGFGCLAVLTFVPGILMGIFLLVPFLQLQLNEPALDLSLHEVQEHRSAQFYSFKDPVLAGPLSYRHSERKSRSSGGHTEHYTAYFQVMPVVGPDWTPKQAPVVWLTSESESQAFDKEPKKLETLSGLELVKPDRGFKRAVKKACERARIPEPENPLLLEQTPPLEQVVEQRRQRLLKWLLPYNVLALLLTLGSTIRRPSPAEKPDTAT